MKKKSNVNLFWLYIFFILLAWSAAFVLLLLQFAGVLHMPVIVYVALVLGPYAILFVVATIAMACYAFRQRKFDRLNQSQMNHCTHT